MAAADQITKALAVWRIPPGDLVYNTGAAFGLLPGWRWPLAAAGVAAVWFFAGILRRWPLPSLRPGSGIGTGRRRSWHKELPAEPA